MRVYDPHKTATEARQANSRLGNFWVLLLSTGLAALALAIIFVVFFRTSPPAA